MSFSIDEQGMHNLVAQLTATGWTGDKASLSRLLEQTHEDSSIRALERHWAWGEGAKDMVLGLVKVGRQRGAAVTVFDRLLQGRGPQVTLSFPDDSRLQALQMQVQGTGEVYIVRRFNGDWRSCRTFRPKAKAKSKHA